MNVVELFGLGLKGFVIAAGFCFGAISFVVVADLIMRLIKAIVKAAKFGNGEDNR